MVTARQAIEYLYRGSCDIFVRVYETDEITHISSSEEKRSLRDNLVEYLIKAYQLPVVIM